MSTLYNRLNRIFSSTRQSTNSIIFSNQKPTNNPKFEPNPKTLNPINAIETTPETQNPTKNPKYPLMNEGLKELLNERDSEKLLTKFLYLSEMGIFRRTQYKIYKFTIHRLTLAKRFNLVEQALESQKKYVCSEGFAARLIYLYGRAGMFDHAYKVFDEMPDRKCPRGTESFRTLLGAAVFSRKLDKAYELFKELPAKLSIKPDVNSYNKVMYAACELGLFDEALSLLDDMDANGLTPDVVSFNTLMGVFYKKGEFERGDKMWEMMVKRGIVPDTNSYNSKVWGLANEGKLTEAVELVEELKSKELKPNVGTYNALIKGCCENDDLEGAKRLYAELLEQECTPNKVTLSTLVPFLCEKGDYGFAFKVCENKFTEQTLVMDEVVLQNVVDGLVKNSMMEEAQTLVKLASSGSYVPYNLTLPSSC